MLGYSNLVANNCSTFHAGFNQLLATRIHRYVYVCRALTSKIIPSCNSSYYRPLLRICRSQLGQFGLRQVLSRQRISTPLARDLSQNVSWWRRSEPGRNRIAVQSGQQVFTLCKTVLGHLGLGSSSGLAIKHMFTLLLHLNFEPSRTF